MIIGELWLAAEDRPQAKTDIYALRNKYKIGGEFKWQKAGVRSDKPSEKIVY